MCSGEAVVSPGGAPESIPEGESTEETKEGATAEPDKEANLSKGAEQNPKDAKDRAAVEGKISEESATQTDKETTQGDEPNKDEAKKEESSSEHKSDGTNKQEETQVQSPEDLEKVFANKTQERLLGLLGAILPQDSKVHSRTQCSLEFGNKSVVLTSGDIR